MYHCLAALLHDVDDRKLFPSAIGYPNAIKILKPYLEDKAIENIKNKISLVSASKNKNSIPSGDLTNLLARDCDRIEAIGEIGVVRCYLYTKNIDRPYFTDDTWIITSESELKTYNLEKRFTDYQNSESMIDHFYDKLLHIGNLQTNNKYLCKLRDTRMHYMKCWLFKVNEIRKNQGNLKAIEFIENWASITGD